MPFDPDAEAFPLELFTLVVEAAREDQPTLLNLCLVSKSLLSISQRTLYRRIRLGGIKVVSVGEGKRRWSILDTNNDVSFFKTLTNIPHLAHRVQHFSFRPDAGHTNKKFRDVFHRALHLMVNLKYLRLTLMTSDRTMFRILEGLIHHPFQLEHFSWKDYRLKMVEQDTIAFSSFISSQPNLRAIDVLSSSSSLALPPASCPNLTTFMGDLNFATSVFQDRPVTNFVWMAGLLEPLPAVGFNWAMGFSNLRLLILYDQFPVDVIIGDLVCHLRSLEVLQISFESCTVPSDSAFQKAMELLLYLPELEKLRAFIWTGEHPALWHTPAMGWVDGFKAAAINFFDNQNMEHVYLRCSSDSQQRYLRWVRDPLRSPRVMEVDADDLARLYYDLDFDDSLIDRRLICGL